MTNIKVLTQDEVADPEVRAMLQAFYSRSPMPIEERLRSLNGDDKELKEDKIKAAIKRYYVDYGHASIGDCGDTTIFIEGVSMLAAKAVQDYPLYRGQECSTRYLDFSSVPFLTADNTPAALVGKFEEIQNAWRSLYLRALVDLVPYVKEKFTPHQVLSPKIPEERREAAYESTVKAIVFDYARGLLPCGASTSLAFHGSMRSLQDHLTRLQRHPLCEVRDIADKALVSLYESYPNSFKAPREDLEPSWSLSEFYYTTDSEYETTFSWSVTPLAKKLLDSEDWDLRSNTAAKLIQCHFTGKLDFGSYRDLQRHRNGVLLMPMVVPRSASHYYMNAYYEASPSLMKDAASLFAEIQCLKAEPLLLQYVCPMMTEVPIVAQWSLDQLRYVTRLRTKTSVHPTLRNFMKTIVSKATEDSPVDDRLARLVDTTPDYTASDRGEQTIKEKLSA